MDPTLLYNNYHLQRRKMFQDNPRNNLKSTIDFVWKNSLQIDLSPKQKLEKKRLQQKRLIGERSNQLIAKRLKKQVGLTQEYRQHNNQIKINKQQSLMNNNNYMEIDKQQQRSKSFFNQKVSQPLQKQLYNNKKNEIYGSNSNYYTDSLNQELHSYNTNKYQTIGFDNIINKSQSLHDSNRRAISELNYCNINQNNNMSINNSYKRQFDPQLQSRGSRRSIASSELTNLTSNNNNFLNKYLNNRLQRYLLNNKDSRQQNNIVQSRLQGNE